MRVRAAGLSPSRERLSGVDSPPGLTVVNKILCICNILMVTFPTVISTAVLVHAYTTCESLDSAPHSPTGGPFFSRKSSYSHLTLPYHIWIASAPAEISKVHSRAIRNELAVSGGAVASPFLTSSSLISDRTLSLARGYLEDQQEQRSFTIDDHIDNE